MTMEERVPKLLAVFAHPDDETFRPGGTLALLARGRVQAQVLTATRGQAGSCGDPPLCGPEQLGAVREAELRCACQALGLEPPRVLNYVDGKLSEIDDAEGTGQVLSVIQELRPHVLLTWPPDGLSGHRDHMAVSRWTRLAFREAVRRGWDFPAALYYVTIARGVAEALGLSHLHSTPDEKITLSVDVTPVHEQKVAAIRCHRTQLREAPVLSAPVEQQRLFLCREHFLLGALRRGGTMRESDVLQELLHRAMSLDQD